MGKRAYGSNSSLLFGWESAYGVPDYTTAYKMPFTANNLGSEQGLIESPILGFGRDPADPFMDVINVDGDLGVPVDPRYLGFWLTALYGKPTTTPQAAIGRITFNTLPVAGNTITINGTVFTFHESASAGTNIEIKGTPALTVAEIVTVLNGSADTDVDDATYAQVEGQAILTITHDTTGPAGNAFTLAASHAAVSAATLQGGCYAHEFKSGASDIPSFWAEGGMPEVPAFFEHRGVKLNSMALNFARSGPAIATLNAIAQSEAPFNVTRDPDPEELDLDVISQFKGALRSGGEFVGNVTTAGITYTNNLERIETLRDDGFIDGADPTVAALTGSFDMRFADTDFIDYASTGTPLDLEFSYRLTPGLSLAIAAHRVRIPKPKIGVSGPGGIPASFNFQSARDPSEGVMVTTTLCNDMDGSDYVPPEE